VRTIVQRVSSAKVVVDGAVVGAIESGLVAYVGVEKGDGDADASTTARKISELRLFPGRTPMDRDVREVGGAVLVISQFTLLASIRRGRRPSFDDAEEPTRARSLYERVCTLLHEQGVQVQTGSFGAYMQVDAIGEGPVTIPITTRDGSLI
jgi:D-tyrosyl-tRNA(Tyr) deacylase